MKPEPQAVVAKAWRAGVATRAVYGLWSRIKTWKAGVPTATAFEGVPDDRFQAARSLYLWLGEQVADRRVLDLTGEGAAGIESLLVAGAKELEVVVANRSVRRYLDRRYNSNRVRIVEQLSARSGFDLVLANEGGRVKDFESLLGLGGRLFIYRFRASRFYAIRSGASGVPAEVQELLQQEIETSFLRCHRLAHLPPPGYLPDWSSRAPARARAQEYRLEPVGHNTGLPASAIGEVWTGSMPRSALPSGRLRVHVGSGMEPLEGWLNVDLLPLPGVDLTLDVTKDFHFSDVEAIYAEHFLEHLEVLDVLDFLANAHTALSDGGLLRLSTPSLDWVWQTHYQREGEPAAKVAAALSINRAFYGWGHRFVWNRELLEQALRANGFEDLAWPSRGESRWEVLRNLERHETYPDYGDLRHVLIVEARKGTADAKAAADLRRRLQEEFVDRVKGWDAVDVSSTWATPRLDD